MTDSKYLTFEWRESVSRRTSQWIVRSRASGDMLGTIKWFGRWRCYAYFPKTEGETVLNAECMRVLADFMHEQTQIHLARRRQEQKASEPVA